MCIDGFCLNFSFKSELLYIDLRHLNVLHFVIEECRHLANGRTAKCAGLFGVFFVVFDISERNNVL